MVDVGKVAMEMFYDRSERYSALMFQDAEQLQGWKGKEEDDDGIPLDPRLQAMQDEKEQSGQVRNAAQDPKTEKTRKPGEKEGDAKNVLNPEDTVERVKPEEKAEKQQKANNEKMEAEIVKNGGKVMHTAEGIQAIGNDGNVVNHTNAKEGQFANADLAFQSGLANIMTQLKTPGGVEAMDGRVAEVSSSAKQKAA
jgi:hypothetical protein